MKIFLPTMLAVSLSVVAVAQIRVCVKVEYRKVRVSGRERADRASRDRMLAPEDKRELAVVEELSDNPLKL